MKASTLSNEASSSNSDASVPREKAATASAAGGPGLQAASNASAYSAVSSSPESLLLLTGSWSKLHS